MSARSDKNRIIIFDTTLRDGEQSPGASMNLDEKLRIAEVLEGMGVDVIEAGFPIASDGDFEAINEIAKVVKDSTVCGLARATKIDIDRAAQALKPAKRGRIHTFIATSELHMKHKLQLEPDEVFAKVIESVTHARSFTDDVEWSAEDASRTEHDFLCRCVEAAIAAGAGTAALPDYASLFPGLQMPRYAARDPGTSAYKDRLTPFAERGFAGASNAWVVSGAHTDTGAPILANDPHLGFAAPILWYLVKIVLPGGFIAGATVPGVPLVLAGHNQAIAWGLTATQSDVQDLYRETRVPGQPDSYETPDGPRPFATRREIIRVRGGEDILLQVRSTRHGPIISRQSAEGALALSATFLGPDDRTPEAIYRINRARGKADFLAALRAMLSELKFESIGKPHPHLAAQALSRTGVSATEAVFVGDNPDTDGAIARAIGTRFVLLRRTGAPE